MPKGEWKMMRLWLPVILAVSLLSANPAATIRSVGSVVKSKGEVQVSRKWGRRTFQIRKGDLLFDRDRVTTQKDSKAYLHLKDRSRIVVADDSAE